MKQAVLMVRVSSDEQKKKGYSLGMQEESLTKYCSKENIEITKIFREDHSAKNFDRPEWNKLMDFIKTNKNEIDYVLFTTWDRFSRNLSEALLVIDKLRSFGIEPIAIEQQIDLSIPETKAMLALYLVMPEIDNDRRSIKVKEGMRGSLKAGRWCGRAPAGYSNVRDENNKPIIVPNKNAKWIQYIFEEVSKGVCQSVIRKVVNKNGFMISRNAMSHFLRNEVYIGKIVISAHNDEPLQIIDGIHKALIEEKLFYEVQDYLKHANKKRNFPKSFKFREELPLRGNINCSKCFNRLTGSASRSKTGNRYFYYHCNHCNKERFRSDHVNEMLENILNEFKFNKGCIELYELMVKKLLNGDSKSRLNDINKIKSDIESTKKRISNLQDMLADNKISPENFSEMKQKYDSSIRTLNEELLEFNTDNSNMKDWLKKGVNVLSNMGEFYSKSSITGKQQLISSIFPENIQFSYSKCRTPRINEALRLMLLFDKGSGKNKKGKLPKNLELSHEVLGMGFEPTRLLTHAPQACTSTNSATRVNRL